MVDKKSGNLLVQPSKGSSSKSLKSGFKALSSGKSVCAINSCNAMVGAEQNGEEWSSPDVVNGLFAAVRFSREALWAMQRVVSRPNTPTENAPMENAMLSVVHDLGKLRDEILSLVTTLEERAEAAEVIRENFDASQVQLSDVDRAWEIAAKAGRLIQVKTHAAIDAHRGLTPERVAELLKD